MKHLTQAEWDELQAALVRLAQGAARQDLERLQPGQEKDMHPSKAYLDAANEVQQWIKHHLATQEKEKEKCLQPQRQDQLPF